MTFVEKWKQIKTKYENAVKEKKPSEKWMGQFRKSSGVEGSCKDLDGAIAKGKREPCEKALLAVKKAGEAYMLTLDKVMDSEAPALKQMKTKTMKAQLDEMLLEAHNAIKGMDEAVFDSVVGPDVMSRALGLKFPKDAFTKSFATNADFAVSYTSRVKSDALAGIQAQFLKEFQYCSHAYTAFMNAKGKTMLKSQALKVALTTLDEIFVHAGREGMLGILRGWESEQAKQTAGNEQKLASFRKSTQYQVLTKIGEVLNADAEKLNASVAILQKIRL